MVTGKTTLFAESFSEIDFGGNIPRLSQLAPLEGQRTSLLLAGKKGKYARPQ
jgi:hypothetical protein